MKKFSKAKKHYIKEERRIINRAERRRLNARDIT